MLFGYNFKLVDFITTNEQSTTTTSLNIDSRPLIYPAELGSLKDELIVSIFLVN